MKKCILAVSVCFLLISFSASAKALNEENQYLESYNRAIFSFNYSFDKYVTNPVVRTYRKVSSKAVRNRINSFLKNTLEPLSAVNYLLQLEPQSFGISVARFAINSTLGLGGLFDVATGWGLKQTMTGFDDTMAVWCIPDGPYLIWPFLGPSTVRSSLGLVADGYAAPVVIASNSIRSQGRANTLTYSYAVLAYLAVKERTYDLTQELERTSVDYYATLRSAYLQNRSAKKCMFGTRSEDADLYDFDFEDVEY